MRTAVYNEKENKWIWKDAVNGTGCCCLSDIEDGDEIVKFFERDDNRYSDYDGRLVRN